MVVCIHDLSISLHSAHLPHLGGTDTILCALLTFILAMKYFPSAQIKAQEELDRVVGPDRLPDFSDASNLPYVNALIREVFRWQPISPIGW